MSEQARLHDQPPAVAPDGEDEFRAAAIRRRRAEAATERRRRLLTVDLGVGLAIALLALLLAPGLAIVGLILILAIGGLLGSMLISRLRRHRAGAAPRPVPAPPSPVRGAAERHG